jgi:hypothetical protein
VGTEVNIPLRSEKEGQEAVVLQFEINRTGFIE